MIKIIPLDYFFNKSRNLKMSQARFETKNEFMFDDDVYDEDDEEYHFCWL